MKAALDNDILSKGTCYGILPELLEGYGGVSKEVGVLGVARFVLKKAIERKSLARGSQTVAEELTRWISQFAELEPTLTEQKLAAEFEALAQQLSVNLDIGESQLCAMVIERTIPVLLTGDKRAIAAVEQLLDKHERLAAVSGLLRCLEQAILDILRPENCEILKNVICSEQEVDKALTICFGCASKALDHVQITEALNSYVRALRKEAGRALAA